jgi:hypothetical protein
MGDEMRAVSDAGRQPDASRRWVNSRVIDAAVTVGERVKKSGQGRLRQTIGVFSSVGAGPARSDGSRRSAAIPIPTMVDTESTGDWAEQRGSSIT